MTVEKIGVAKSAVAALLSVLAVVAAYAARIDVYPQSFDAGGWGLDVQFMDVMGSPYLIAHGRGIRVTDATASVSVPEAGRWNVYVRTRKWVDGAGSFKVAVGGKELDHIFGRSQNEWAWEKGGEVELPAGETEVRLVDLDGFDGRVAGVVLVKGEAAPQGARSLADAAVSETVEADFVVVGGGLPGTCAAVAAARRGLRVAILNDRPVLGGNASSEIRVWSGGEARYPLVKELRGWFMNRNPNMALSDVHRMRVVANEKTLSAHLCMRAFAAETKDGRITAVKALDWKRNRVVRFTAPLFCDATGDGWVGYWAGADYRMGREAKSEYNESFAPEKADGDTLGASLMWSSAEANTDIPFSAPWAEKWACGEKAVMGKWNWEYGIHHDMFKDAEWIRDRLLLAIYGASRRKSRRIPAWSSTFCRSFSASANRGGLWATGCFPKPTSPRSVLSRTQSPPGRGASISITTTRNRVSIFLPPAISRTTDGITFLTARSTRATSAICSWPGVASAARTSVSAAPA